VELDQEIPEILYEAIVQVLIFAYQLSEKEIPGQPKSSQEPERHS
jgi:flagellar biosynthesis protein